MSNVTLGTPFTTSAKKILLLGSGELGKEVVIELQRFGCEVVAVDSYEHAPAMQVADRFHIIKMLDGEALRAVILQEKPDLIVPEVEAIATEVLVELEGKGFKVVPTARAAQLTMNREGIRVLAAEELNLKCSDYKFADTLEEFRAAVHAIGMPCFVKPVVSSSGKGQSKIKTEADIEAAWTHSQTDGRTGPGKVIVEGAVPFDYEITLLTVRHAGGTTFCDPIGHRQEDGDYQESWQPQPMSAAALEASKHIAQKITDALGGWGIFGVELFVKGDEVWFSEVSPRPHDTGLVTIVSQNLSEFALHARAILGLPIPEVVTYGPSASAVIMAKVDSSSNIIYSNLAAALAEPQTELRLFGKPWVKGKRRMGVVAARAESIEKAREKATKAATAVVVDYAD